jgi:hypothetical protein
MTHHIIHNQGSDSQSQSLDVTLMCVRARDFPFTAAVGLHLMLLMVFIMVHDIKIGLKILCHGAPSFALYSSALKCRSFPSHSFIFQLPFLYLTLGSFPS